MDYLIEIKVKQLLFKLASRKIECMAKKYQVHYHFIFVHADGKQLQEAVDILTKANVHPVYGDIFLTQTIKWQRAAIRERFC